MRYINFITLLTFYDNKNFNNIFKLLYDSEDCKVIYYAAAPVYDR